VRTFHISFVSYIKAVWHIVINDLPTTLLQQSLNICFTITEFSYTSFQYLVLKVIFTYPDMYVSGSGR